MKLNPIGALTMFKTMDMVPNFSELARTFGRTGTQSRRCTKRKGGNGGRRNIAQRNIETGLGKQGTGVVHRKLSSNRHYTYLRISVFP